MNAVGDALQGTRHVKHVSLPFDLSLPLGVRVETEIRSVFPVTMTKSSTATQSSDSTVVASVPTSIQDAKPKLKVR